MLRSASTAKQRSDGRYLTCLQLLFPILSAMLLVSMNGQSCAEENVVLTVQLLCLIFSSMCLGLMDAYRCVSRSIYVMNLFYSTVMFVFVLLSGTENKRNGYNDCETTLYLKSAGYVFCASYFICSVISTFRMCFKTDQTAISERTNLICKVT